jgi:hypothetical protein
MKGSLTRCILIAIFSKIIYSITSAGVGLAATTGFGFAAGVGLAGWAAACCWNIAARAATAPFCGFDSPAPRAGAVALTTSGAAGDAIGGY